MNTNVGSSHVRLYRYLSEKWTLTSIETGELRVGRLAELNDPFEFMPALRFVNPMFPHAVVDDYINFLVRDFDPKWGILCFSEQIHDPVVWSHYADCHKGIALGFDVFRDDHLWPMKYPPARPALDLERFPSMTTEEAKTMIQQILSAKAPSWEYEKEHRTFVDLASSRVANGNYFHPIPPNCLKHVVLGIRCTATETAVQAKLKQGGFSDVIVSRAKRCLTHFRVLH